MTFLFEPNLPFVREVAINSVLVLVLTSLIAYHPAVIRKRSSIRDVELPKTMFIYSLIGMIVGILIKEHGEAVAFAVFGLGGLMRFRTDVGSTKETGRLIFVTLGGMCLGLEVPSLAIFAFLATWIVIYVTEYKNLFRIIVRFDDLASVSGAANHYRDALNTSSGKIVSEKRGSLKPQIEFVLQADSTLTRDMISAHLSTSVPAEFAGSIEWDLR